MGQVTGFERTLVLIKPDAMARRLAGRILSRFEDKGLTPVGLKLVAVSEDLAARLYAEHRDKPFYDGLVRFITSGPVIALAAEGKEAIEVCRRLAGATCGREARPGTIRGDFGMSNRFNLVHASDTPVAARRELDLFFRADEMLGTDATSIAHVYDLSGPEPL